MVEPTLASQVFRLIEQAESYSDSQEASRRRALSFYNGDKEAIPYDKTFSSVVSKDVLDVYPRKVCLLPASGRAMVKRLAPTNTAELAAAERAAVLRPAADAGGSIDLF